MSASPLPVVASLGLLLGACAAPSTAPRPQVEVTPDWRPGTALTGAVDPRYADAAAPHPAAEPRTLLLRWHLAPPAPAGGETLSQLAELVMRPGTRWALGGVPTVLPQLRILRDAATRQHMLAIAAAEGERPATDPPVAPAALALALVPGAAASAGLHLVPPAGAADEQPLDWTLVVELQSDREARCTVVAASAAGVTEHVQLTWTMPCDGEPLAFHLPDGGGCTLLAALSSLPPAPTELGRARAAAATARQQVLAPPRAPASFDQGVTDAQLQAARDAIGADLRRPALLSVAERFGAVRCADLALVGDDQTLIALSAGLPAGLAALPTEQAGLTLDVLALSTVAPRLRQLDLPRPLLAWIRRHAGAAGYSQSVLMPLLQGCTTAAELELRLVEANIDALDDGDAATRITAHDWLSERGAAIPEYDPLGEQHARNQALLRDRTSRAARGVR